MISKIYNGEIRVQILINSITEFLFIERLIPRIFLFFCDSLYKGIRRLLGTNVGI